MSNNSSAHGEVTIDIWEVTFKIFPANNQSSFANNENYFENHNKQEWKLESCELYQFITRKS